MIAIISIADLNRYFTETILPYARIYAFYILVSAPAMASSCVMNNVLRYEGYANLAMVGLVSGGILNMAEMPVVQSCATTFHHDFSVHILWDSVALFLTRPRE